MELLLYGCGRMEGEEKLSLQPQPLVLHSHVAINFHAEPTLFGMMAPSISI